jgi:alpha(1,3/1,4) fucosyltransferase
MRHLRIAFTDHYVGFNSTDNRIWNVLKKHYHLELATDLATADLLVFSDFGINHWEFNGRKIYLTGENMLPDFDQCDLAFTPVELPEDKRAVRLPLYAQYTESLPSLIRQPEYNASNLLKKKGFCSFLVSNPGCRLRNQLFKKIHRKRAVASGGKHFNTVGEIIKNKSEFIKDYQFNIACENSSSPGYITEKLIDPLLVGSIPIYWGDPEISRDFDLKCMINVRDFKSLNDLAEYLLVVAENDALRQRILEAPVFRDNKLPLCTTDEYISEPMIDLLENRNAGIRIPRRRRLREHLKSEKNYFTYKFEKLSCKIESILWNSGVRIF